MYVCMYIYIYIQTVQTGRSCVTVDQLFPAALSLYIYMYHDGDGIWQSGLYVCICCVCGEDPRRFYFWLVYT